MCRADMEQRRPDSTLRAPLRGAQEDRSAEAYRVAAGNPRRLKNAAGEGLVDIIPGRHGKMKAKLGRRQKTNVTAKSERVAQRIARAVKLWWIEDQPAINE